MKRFSSSFFHLWALRHLPIIHFMAKRGMREWSFVGSLRRPRRVPSYAARCASDAVAAAVDVADAAAAADASAG